MVDGYLYSPKAHSKLIVSGMGYFDFWSRNLFSEMACLPLNATLMRSGDDNPQLHVSNCV